MISIIKATVNDYKPIVEIGKISVEESHRESCSAKEMIQEELRDENNIYHIIYYNGIPAGFSKIILNAPHTNIQQLNVTKLDRIYLLKEYFNLKLGLQLLNFNIELSKSNHQTGIWLFTWVGNKRAVDFYLKTGFSIVGSHQFKVTDTHYNLNHQMFLNYNNTI